MFAVAAGCMAVAVATPALADQQARTAVPVSKRASIASLARVDGDRSKQSLETRLAEDLRAMWAGRALQRGTTAMYVVDAKTGEPLFAVHEERGLNPASNVKLVSTATALHVLGPSWRYVTQMLGPQPDRNGVIRGDVYLYGNADPTLRAVHLAAFATDLVAAGVSKIDGAVLASTDELRDTLGRPTVSVKVTGAASGKPPTVEITPANDFVTVQVTAKSTTRRRRPRIKVSGTMLEPAEDNEITRPTYALTVSGEIRPGQSRTYHRKVPSPALFSAHVLRGALIEAGIDVTGDARLVDLESYVSAGVDAGYLPVELARHESAPVSKLVKWVNKPSNNFLADRLLMTVGAVRYGGAPSLVRGVDAMNEWLEAAGIHSDEVVLDTGSGLSYNSRLSPKHIVRVLRTASGYAEANTAEPIPDLADALAMAGGAIEGRFAIGDTDDRAPVLGGEAEDVESCFHDSLAVAGIDGTLRRRYSSSSLKGLMVGKTGTLTRVIALSGFVSLGDDDTVAFAILTNGHRQSRRNTVRYEHRKMAQRVLEYLEARKQRRENAPPPAAQPASASDEPIEEEPDIDPEPAPDPTE